MNNNFQVTERYLYDGKILYIFYDNFIFQRKDAILPSFKPLQRGIAECMSCQNMKVIRAVHSLLSRLMMIFPTEPVNSNVASKYEELDTLYARVSKVVYEGLNNYDR